MGGGRASDRDPSRTCRQAIRQSCWVIDRASLSRHRRSECIRGMTNSDGWFGTPDATAFPALSGEGPLTDAACPDPTIVDRLRATARMHPDRVACRDGARVVRFDALCQAVDRLAAHISLAADRSGPVGIVLP